MSKLKNKNHEKFCNEYVENGLNGTHAYMKAYPNCKKETTAKVNASRLLTNANVMNRIKELREKVEETAILSLQKRQELLTSIALGVDTKTHASTSDRLKAIDMLNKMEGSYTDNIKVNGNVGLQMATLEDMTKQVIEKLTNE